MAIKPKDIPITRRLMHEEILPAAGSRDAPEFRDRLEAELSKYVNDLDVDISERTDLEGDTMPLVDLIMLDLDSYA